MSLNLAKKVEILDKLDRGIAGKRLALDYNVAASTISYIKKQRKEIREAVAGTCDEVKKKNLRKAENPEMEEALYKWFLEQRARNVAIDGTILKAKGLELSRKMNSGDNSFKASDGWLRNFKLRRGIRFISICGEKMSCDMAAIDPFIRKFCAVVDEMDLTHDQIYNADESSLFYRLLPHKTFVAACEKTAPGEKVKKDRITFMLCCNATATHKLKPLVIGKAKKPRCFVGFDNPLVYRHSKSAWMTTNIFTDWFHNSFVKDVSYFDFMRMNSTNWCAVRVC